ncbi:MAG: Mrp/NBP35 family ATP-binding protein [Pirellulaceae bacterium]
MSKLDAQSVKDALKACKDPETGRSVVDTEQLGEVNVDGGVVSVTLNLASHSAPLRDDMRAAVVELLQARFSDAKQVQVTIGEHHRPPQKLGAIGLTAKSVIAVGSGKGGVGKSTVAACLALGLKRAGCKVGLMDADVYGPSIPHLLGLHATQQDVMGEKKLQPILADGLPVMSMGFLVPPGEAVVWRGPMLHGAVTQFLRDTDWGELDYLIIDMPPGTGDIALSLSQAIPLTGAVVVCTPQEVALLDAVKAIAMFRKVSIPVLGMVENMSGFICPDCNKRYDIFGSGGARAKAEQLGVPFLGELPINMAIRSHGDEGKTIENFSDPQATPYLEKLVYRLSRYLADQAIASPPRPSLPVL